MSSFERNEKNEKESEPEKPNLSKAQEPAETKQEQPVKQEQPATQELNAKETLQPLDFSPSKDERSLQLSVLKSGADKAKETAQPFMPALDLVSEKTVTFPAQKAESESKSLFKNGELKQAREQALKDGVPILIDIGATWCGPCRALDRAMSTKEAELNGKAKVVKLDIDKLLSDPAKLPAAEQAQLKEQKQILKDLGIKPEEIQGVPYLKLLPLNKDGKPASEGKDLSGFPLNPSESQAWFNSLYADCDTLKKEMAQSNTKLEKPAVKSKFEESQNDEQSIGKSVKLDEGTYERNENGQITKTISSDGKTVRELKYEDKQNPDRVTSLTINGEREFRFVGNNKYSDGLIVKKDGYEMSSYAIYEKGKLTGNFNGALSMSKNGVLTTGDGSKALDHLDASSRAITEENRLKREADGIWPSKLTATLNDGSQLTGHYKGTTLDELEESRKLDEDTFEISIWKKDGDSYTNPAYPGEVRKNMSLKPDGTLSFTDQEGKLQTKYKDGASAVTENGITRKSDAQGNLVELTNKDGDKRRIEWEDGKIAAVTTERKDKNGAIKTETLAVKEGDKEKQELKITADGAIEYKRENGNLIRDDFRKTTEYDQLGRPLELKFESGAKRQFTYDGDKLQAIKDTFTASGGEEKQRTLTRKGDSDVFVLDENKKERIIEGLPDPDGDYQYRNKVEDKTSRTSKSYDLERIARGELSLSSDNLQEAKEDLLSAARAQNMNTERLDRFVGDLEKNATKWGVKEESLVKSLDNIRALLDEKLESPLYSRKELNQLAETALHNIGNPMQIDQGAHPTCNITTVEIYTATKHPDVYTQLVRDVASKGSWTTAEGEKCTPPKEALRPGDDEKAYDIDKPSNKVRNISSQLVQMSLINAMYATGRMDQETAVNGVKQVESRRDWNYIMVPSQKVTGQELYNGQMVQVTRTIGEDRLRNGKGQFVGKEDSGPNLTVEDNIEASKMLLKSAMPYVAGPYRLGNDPWVYDLPDAQRLNKAKQDGMLPMGVPTIGGAHVQTIHDIAKNSAGETVVLLDNQHGERMDGWVTIPQLHQTIKEKIELKPSINRFGKPFPADVQESSRPSY